ncbi:hypothetical protein TUMEXPCC7403_16940 [Tumidithrix helvetica PCC 7403]|uniref:hypothetical protein n=1 Tax=Tumidithrix helvetica TaxID=3457545 RepID=UPI003CA798D5
MAKPISYYVRLSALTTNELASLSPHEQLDLARGLIEVAQAIALKKAEEPRHGK